MRLAYDIHECFHKVACMEATCMYEIETWGKVSYETMRQRHYHLKRLLKKQMEEFDAN